MRRGILLLVALLALVGCESGERQRAEQRAKDRELREAAKAAAHAAAEQRTAEAVAAVKGALAALSRGAAAEEVRTACEPGLIANALRLDSEVAEACSNAYVALAEKALREHEWTQAVIFMDQQRLTGVQSPEVDRAQTDLEAAREAARGAGRSTRAPKSQGHSSDWRQAQEFLAQLPPACASSTASVATDGSVVIRLLCFGTQTMDGRVRIKNGVVTEIQ